MNRQKAIVGIIVIALMSLVAIPVTQFLIAARLYREAEPVAEQMQALYSRTQDMSMENVRAVLTNEEFRLLRSYRIEYAADTNVVLWVPVNRKFTIGLGRDGRVVWQVDR
jgi:hypothetical protein